MPLEKNTKIGLTVLIVTIVIVAPIIMLNIMNQVPPPDNGDTTLEPLEVPVSSFNVTLLDTAGVMIEANNIRIYIDPYRIPKANFSEYPADLVLITHGHADHYSHYDIMDVAKDDTMVVLPESMSEYADRYNYSQTMNPGDDFQYRGINITAFKLYLDDYPNGGRSAHPRDNNWTSYIIEIDGFIFFHAGDAKYMPEYENFPVNIDVAFLPIYYDPGYGDKNESLAPIIRAIDTLTPDYCIPTHWYFSDNDLFMNDYVSLLEDDCEVMNLDFFEWHVFENTG